MTAWRWPDGSMVAENPHAAARQLEAQMVGWRCWYGKQTRSFWAVQLGRGGQLVEAATIGDLAERMNRTSATQAPASPSPRGWGAPVPGHSGRRAPRRA